MVHPESAGEPLHIKQPAGSWLALPVKDEPQRRLFRVCFGKDHATPISFGIVVPRGWGRVPACFSQVKSESLAGVHSTSPKPAKQQKR